MKKLIVSLSVAFVASVMVFAFVGAFFLMTSPGSSTEKITFEVRPGLGLNQVSQGLEKDGLVRSAKAFSVFARLSGHSKKVRVGEYELNKGMTPSGLLAVLTTGKSIERPITFPEGLNIYEMAKIIEDRGLGTESEFLRLCRDQAFISELLKEKMPSLEGYLFPETYMITKFTTLRQLLRTMVERFESVFQSEIAADPRFSATKMSRHQLVILASLIEKESGMPEDRPLIASVFKNRLKKGMKLQTDPTIIYGIADKTGKIITNIRRKDINEYTRYNTYRVPALPYGPIANPGTESLKAAILPISASYLYFVSRNDGTTLFSNTLVEHNKAVKKFQLDRKMRVGKSWRDRYKKKAN